MRIGLINAYSTLNLGDAAIYSAFRQLLPDVELVGCVQDERPDATLGVTFLSERPRNCDAYVSVGGTSSTIPVNGLSPKPSSRTWLN